jgi:hypothetical protein
MSGDMVVPALDLNRTPVHGNSAQAPRKRPTCALGYQHARAMQPVRRNGRPKVVQISMLQHLFSPTIGM